MPFSNMLDLATAKAENITGLYFAKQMNNQPKGSGSMEPGMSTLQGSGEPQEDGQAKQQTRAVTSTESPVTDHTAGSFTGPTDIGKNCVPPVLVLDGVRIPGSPVTATTPSTPAFAGAFQGTPLTPATKSLHRRSHSASHFFHLSSLKHHSPAQFNLALCYEHGQGGVEQDLAKALHFYQQAADQGHTKASYNLGCICYNQGEISKAMAWFESAGKCGVQGLKVDAGVLSSSSSSSSSVPGGVQKGGVPLLECPMPKATILPHELEDMLMLGDHTSGPEGSAGGGGPFVAYLPAILCLALLCRQGVQTREGEVILRRDPDQAVALLQRLLDRAPARMLNKLEKDHQQSRPQLVLQQPSLSSMSASDSGRSIGVAAKRDPRKRASLQTVPTLQQQGGATTTASSIFSTSCPQLPLGLSSSMSSSSSSCSTPFSGRGGGGVRVKRPSTVEDAMDDDDDDYESSFCPAESRSSKIAQNPRQSSGSCQRYIPDSEEDYQEEEKQYGSDVHEAWSVTLAQQLLKAWQQPPPSKQGRATPGSASTEDDGRIQQRIVRHHLLYITNPTLGKNFYNLGVLYDLYLGHAQIAQRCYRSAYQNCRPCLPPLTPVSVLNDAILSCAAATDRASKQQQQQQQLQLAGLVTRINSAWNLGVLHAKHQEWSRAKSWFLKAQQDVLAHERIVAASVESVAQDQRQRREGGRSAGGGEREIVSDLTALLMKQGGGGGDGEEAEWSSKVEELLSLDGSGSSASETKQRKAVVSEKRHRGADVVQQEDMDEFKTRRRSLVNVLPSPAPGGQSNISARGGRGEQRGRSGGRTSGNDGIGARGDALLGTKDSPGSRHAREHGLMMHLSSSSAGSSSSSKRMSGGASSTVKSSGKKGSSSSLSREGGTGGRGSSGGSGGIRTDASKVAWVLRWVESNMDSPSSTSSLSL
jgi:tetratricopeptide (TPR) repeat protein